MKPITLKDYAVEESENIRNGARLLTPEQVMERLTRADIPLLAEHSLHRNVTRYRLQPTTLTPAALSALQEYHWPGNGRELEQVVAVAMVEAQGSPIQPAHLRFTATTKPRPRSHTGRLPTLGAPARQCLLQVLEPTHGAIGGLHGAARPVQTNPSARRSRRRKLDLPPGGARPC